MNRKERLRPTVALGDVVKIHKLETPITITSIMWEGQDWIINGVDENGLGPFGSEYPRFGFYEKDIRKC